MLLSELIERLQDLAEAVDGKVDPEVRLAVQENYPLQSSVRGVAASWEGVVDDDDDDDDDKSRPPVVWIVEGSQVSDDPYAPDGVFSAAY